MIPIVIASIALPSIIAPASLIVQVIILHLIH